ncbi:MAG: hypothetical protein WDW36_008160 [Sanguina aurantia]
MTLTFGSKSKTSLLKLQPRQAGPLSESTETASRHTAVQPHTRAHHSAAAWSGPSDTLSHSQQQQQQQQQGNHVQAHPSPKALPVSRVPRILQDGISKLLPRRSDKAGKARHKASVSSQQLQSSSSSSRQLYTPHCCSLLSLSSHGWSSAYATAAVAAAALSASAGPAPTAPVPHGPTGSQRAPHLELHMQAAFGGSGPVAEADEGESPAAATTTTPATTAPTSNGSGAAADSSAAAAAAAVTAAAAAATAAAGSSAQRSRARGASSSGAPGTLLTAGSAGSGGAAAAAADETAAVVVGTHRPGLHSHENDREVAILGKQAPLQDRGGHRAKRLCVRPDKGMQPCEGRDLTLVEALPRCPTAGCPGWLCGVAWPAALRVTSADKTAARGARGDAPPLPKRITGSSARAATGAALPPGGPTAAPHTSATGGLDEPIAELWLDELIVALWHDLQSYMEWKQLDAELLRTRGRPHAGLLLGWKREGGAERGARAASGAGMEERDEFSDTDSVGSGVWGHDPDQPASPPLPTLSQADWMRRGQLAERLNHDEDALLAFSASLQLGFSVTAWVALLRLAVLGSDVSLGAACHPRASVAERDGASDRPPSSHDGGSFTPKPKLKDGCVVSVVQHTPIVLVSASTASRSLATETTLVSCLAVVQSRELNAFVARANNLPHCAPTAAPLQLDNGLCLRPRPVLRGVNELMSWHDRQQPLLSAPSPPTSPSPPFTSASGSRPPAGQRARACPTAVLVAVCNVIAVSGPEAVVAAHQQFGEPHPALLSLIEGMAAWAEAAAALG